MVLCLGAMLWCAGGGAPYYRVVDFLWRAVLPYYVVILDNPEIAGVPGCE